MRQLFIVLFLMGFLSLSAQSSWVQINNYPFPLTQVTYDTNGVEYATIQDGRVYKDNQIVKVFPVMDTLECGLVSIEVEGFYLYLHLSGVDSFQRVIRYDTQLATIDTLIEVPYKAPFGYRHRGGDIVIKDSILYTSFGYGQNFNDAQEMTDNRGKLLTVNLNSGDIDIIASGLRNPFRFDISDTVVYIGDVGWNSFEEVDRLIIDSTANFGWPCYEANMILNDTCQGELTPPIYAYPHSGPQTVIGGVFWNGEWLFCDHYTGIGGSVDTFGPIDTFPIEFPQYVTSMAVNPLTNDLVVATWAGQVYKYQEQPLSIDTIYEDEYERKRDSLEHQYWLEDMKSYFGDIYISLDGKEYLGLPRVPGAYYALWDERWIMVINE